MIVGDMPDPADLLVVGGGPGGYVAAIRAAQLGRRVVLVDRDEWGGPGGACLHVGCIPSKALIELGATVARLANGTQAGVVAREVRADLAAFQAGQRTMIAGLANGVAGLLRRHKVEVRTGELRFTAPRRAVVSRGDGVTHLEFTDAVIATGSRPLPLPDGPAVDGVRVLDSAGLLALDERPASLCVVGGGYVGLELGTAFAKLGTRVTVVEARDRLGAAFEPDVMAVVERSLRALGVTVLPASQVVGVDDGHVVVRARDGSERRVEAELVGVTAGRRPNTEGLGLETLGVELRPDGRIGVDATCRAAPHVAAVGDVTPGPALAHKATAEAVVAAEVLSGRPAVFAPEAIPVAMFTDPEVAVTGLTAEQAGARGPVVARCFPVAALGRAASLGARAGFVRLVARADDGALLGAQLVGPHASELIAEATLAVEMGATLTDLAMTIHAHPTLSEGLKEAAQLGLGQPIHVPGEPSTQSVSPC